MLNNIDFEGTVNCLVPIVFVACPYHMSLVCAISFPDGVPFMPCSVPESFPVKDFILLFSKY